MKKGKISKGEGRKTLFFFFFFFFFGCLLLLAFDAGIRSIFRVMSTYDHEPESYGSTPDAGQVFPLILTVVLLVFFLIGFFSLYLCRYLANASWLQAGPPNAQALRSGSDGRCGLHPSIVASFPTFTYAQVRDHRQMECAVCLSEFADDDVLRLLTACSHAFHPGCIDLWFESHTTCPVCRQDLDPAEKSPEKTPDLRVPVPETDEREEEERVEESSRQRISFKEDEEEEEEDRRRRRDAGVASERREHVAVVVDWLPRSHSTGHSLVENNDRFALRLPENVKERIARERNWTRSCVVLEDLSTSLFYGRKEESAIECSDFSAARSQMT